jgi:molybdopterin/thiamine biosynthesis adenylyltransferase
LKRIADRYDRQARIPEWDQSRLKRAKVFIAGLGALGNEVAKNLALAGIGNLQLLDFDRVEYTNLNRTVLFSAEDVGSPKVRAASRSIRRINPSISVTAFHEKLQELVEGHGRALQTVDLLVGCLDNREARFILNHLSVAHRIPYVDGGMLNAMGSVRVSVPPYTPCLECDVPQSAYAQIGQRYRCEDLVFDDLTLQQMGVRHPTISTVTSITGAIQAHEALKILLGIDLFRSTGRWAQGTGKPIENEIQYDCRTNGFLIQSVHRETRCYVCGTEEISIDPVKPISISIASGNKLGDIIRKTQSMLGTWSFNLVRGLRPFPDRTTAIVQARNIFQKLQHLMRLVAKSGSDGSCAQECYRIIRACSESSKVRKAQDALRKGIPFHPNSLVAAMDAVRYAIESISSRASALAPECLLTIIEIRESIGRTLSLLNDDLPVEMCQLKDKEILCAIRHRQTRLHDVALEVTFQR